MAPKPHYIILLAAALLPLGRGQGACVPFPEYEEVLDLKDFTPGTNLPEPRAAQATPASSPGWPNLARDGYVSTAERLPEYFSRDRALAAQSVNSKLETGLRQNLKFYIYASDEESLVLDSPWIVVSRASSGEKTIFPFLSGKKAVKLAVVEGSLLEIEQEDNQGVSITYLDLTKITHSATEGSTNFAEIGRILPLQANAAETIKDARILRYLGQKRQIPPYSNPPLRSLVAAPN